MKGMSEVQIVRGRASQDMPSQNRTETFTGTVWGDPVLPTTAEGTTINSVTFAPGARTYWHHHAAGQILIVTSGMGWVASEGQAPETIRAGDVVWVPPGERHWHGGSAETMMTHTSISIGQTTWSEEVSELDYLAAADKGQQ
jgi:quercetin dioxygenase-like cupin family protein